MEEILYYENVIPEQTLQQIWREIESIENSMGNAVESGASSENKNGSGLLMNSTQAELVVPIISSIKNVMDHSGDWSVLINHYPDGGYYNNHTDDSKYTLTIPLIKDGTVLEGGDFYFRQFDQKYIMRHNSLLMFPGNYEHQVTTVNIKEGSFGRYSITFFFY